MKHSETFIDIAEDIRLCFKCPLWKNRIYTLPGVIIGTDNNLTRSPAANPKANTVLITESVVEADFHSGIPLSGKPTLQIARALKEVGLDYSLFSQTAILSLLKCPIKGASRAETDNAIIECRDYLVRQINYLTPHIIVTFGKTPFLALMNNPRIRENWRRSSMESISQKTYVADVPWGKTIFIPTFHPNATLQNRRRFEHLKSSLLKLKKAKAPIKTAIIKESTPIRYDQ
jgi:uracil-DNA glycosylase family 4